jgi:hypothetical protein
VQFLYFIFLLFPAATAAAATAAAAAAAAAAELDFLTSPMSKTLIIFMLINFPPPLHDKSGCHAGVRLPARGEEK